MARLNNLILFLLLVLPVSAQVMQGPIMRTIAAAGGGGGTPALVDFASSAGSSSASSQTISQTIGSGNLVVIFVKWEDAARTITVSDTLGNTYTSITNLNHVSAIYGQMFYAKNTASGATTITVSFGATTAWCIAGAWELSGCDTASPVDVWDTDADEDTAIDGISLTTTDSDTVILCGEGNYAARTLSPSANWTEDLDSGASYGTAWVHRTVSSTGTYTGIGTLNNAAAFVAIAAAFK